MAGPCFLNYAALAKICVSRVQSVFVRTCQRVGLGRWMESDRLKMERSQTERKWSLNTLPLLFVPAFFPIVGKMLEMDQC